MGRMTPNPPRTDCLLWVYDSSFERLLVSQGAAPPALPRVTVETGHYPRVAPVVEAAKRRWGLDITVLRCLSDRRPESNGPGLREYYAYCHSPPSTLAHGLRWVQVSEAEPQLPSSSENEVPGPGHITEGVVPRPDSASRVPWERGEEWSEEALGWIRRTVSRLGLVSAGPPRQLQVWSISTVYKVPTNSGPLFFKASPDFFPAEAAITEDLSRRHPRNTPRVLAADRERNWLLMADLGETSF